MRCERRGDKCSLVSPSNTTRSDALLPASKRGDRGGDDGGDALTLTDLKLFHHFTTTTCHYMAAPHATSPWLDAIPTMALDHPFLLHELMAVAAVDLASAATSAGESRAHLELARRHHARSLAGLTPAITSRRADLVQPVWACNSLFVPYYFATTSDAASLLFTADPPGPAEWMLPLRGAVTLFRTHEAALLSGPVGVHLRPYRDRCREADLGKGRGDGDGDEDGDGDGDAETRRSGASEAPLERVIARLQQSEYLSLAEEERPAMAGALLRLRQCFAISDRGDAMGKKTAALTFCAMAPGEFFASLGRRAPAALVVMALWCLLLHRAEQGRWWLHVNFKQVPELLGCLHSLLSPEVRNFISWPVEEIGLPRDAG